MSACSPLLWQTSLGPLSLEAPLYLGILNITPDSMSDGGQFLEPEAALAQARQLLAQGVTMLDVGAESTRPQAAPVDAETEWQRLAPVLARLRAELPELPLSLDTRHALVAVRGLQLGVAAINDVTGFRDAELLHVANNSGCGLIAMRSRLVDGAFAMPPYGLPGTDRPDQAIQELERLRDHLLGAGVAAERILLDPGFGFGTKFSEDQALWDALGRLPAELDWPVERFCLGISRKRFLAWRAGNPGLEPAGRDPLTARAHLEALELGYRVLRSHTGPLAGIRLAEPGDIEQLAQIQVASWRAAYREVIPGAVLDQLQPEPLAEGFLRMLEAPAAPTFRLWIVDWQGRAAGYAATGPCREPGSEPGTAEVHAIYFLRETWRLGLGRQLMARILDEHRAQGFHTTTLWVLERNTRARRFYEAGGWQACGAPRTIWHDGIALREVQYQYRHNLTPDDLG